jgi:hypothetical protein
MSNFGLTAASNEGSSVSMTALMLPQLAYKLLKVTNVSNEFNLPTFSAKRWRGLFSMGRKSNFTSNQQFLWIKRGKLFGIKFFSKLLDIIQKIKANA